MARMRERMIKVSCPVCGGYHYALGKYWLYQATGVWIGYITSVYCRTRDMSFYKLYDENYKYVCWQQNTRNSVPDYQEIPF